MSGSPGPPRPSPRPPPPPTGGGGGRDGYGRSPRFTRAQARAQDRLRRKKGVNALAWSGHSPPMDGGARSGCRGAGSPTLADERFEFTHVLPCFACPTQQTLLPGPFRVLSAAGGRRPDIHVGFVWPSAALAPPAPAARWRRGRAGRLRSLASSHPCSSTGLGPPAAEKGVNALAWSGHSPPMDGGARSGCRGAGSPTLADELFEFTHVLPCFACPTLRTLLPGPFRVLSAAGGLWPDIHVGFAWPSAALAPPAPAANGRREWAGRLRSLASFHPCSSTGLRPPAAEKGRERPCLVRALTAHGRWGSLGLSLCRIGPLGRRTFRIHTRSPLLRLPHPTNSRPRALQGPFRRRRS